VVLKKMMNTTRTIAFAMINTQDENDTVRKKRELN